MRLRGDVNYYRELGQLWVGEPDFFAQVGIGKIGPPSAGLIAGALLGDWEGKGMVQPAHGAIVDDLSPFESHASDRLQRRDQHVHMGQESRRYIEVVRYALSTSMPSSTRLERAKAIRVCRCNRW